MIHAHILCDPWDLACGNLDESLGLLQGTLGATGITLFAAVAPTVSLARDPAERLRVIRTRGGVLYRPDPARYAATRCKPAVADGPKSRPSIDEIVERCRGRGLGVRIAASTLRLGRMACRYPWAAVKNALDDVSPLLLCPASADVVEVLAALAAELTDRFRPDAVVLYDFDRGVPGEVTAGLALPPDRTAAVDALLSLCFCESCRQRAARDGAPVEAALRSVQQWVERLLKTPPGAEPAPSAFRDDDVVRAYASWQSQVLASALGLIRSRVSGGVHLHFRDEPDLPPDRRENAVMTLSALWTHVNVVVRACVPPLGRDLTSPTESFSRRAEGRTILEVEFPARLPSLVAAVTSAVGEGVSGLQFSGMYPVSSWSSEAVRQAIRYARRSTDG